MRQGHTLTPLPVELVVEFVDVLKGRLYECQLVLKVQVSAGVCRVSSPPIVAVQDGGNKAAHATRRPGTSLGPSLHPAPTQG